MDIEDAVEKIERILQPNGRCTDCGGGEMYWKHLNSGDPLEGFHLFQAPKTIYHIDDPNASWNLPK